MPRRLSTGRLITISLTGLLAVGAAQGDGYIGHHDIYVQPSNLVHVTDNPNKEAMEFSCYAVYDGTPIDCHFSFSLSYPPPTSPPWVANGGHYHDEGSRPLIYRQRHFVGSRVYYDGAGSLEYPSDTDPDPMKVQGETLPEGTFPGVPYADRAIVEYPLPEVSGEVQMDTQLTTPPGWYCADASCYTFTTWRRRDLLHVGVLGLVEVPDPDVSGHHYIKNRTAETQHPNSVAFNIKPEHLPQLYAIADQYYTAYQSQQHVQRVLSLNDMTLPLGGLFDVRHDWTPPHRSHRDGTDADVNQGGIQCRQDHILIRVLRQELPNLRDRFGKGGNTDSALWCEEPTHNKHIDFER